MGMQVLAAARPRKLAIKFKLGAPLPVPRTVLRTTRRGHEIGVLPNGQFGYLVTRPRNGGDFTRALVWHAGQWRPSARAARIEAAEQEDLRTRGDFEYLEGLELLDVVDDGDES